MRLTKLQSAGFPTPGTNPWASIITSSPGFGCERVEYRIPVQRSLGGSVWGTSDDCPTSTPYK